MKTFTNYAEKKAKQFLNLLQGYTKGIRLTAILILLLMGVSNAWGVSICKTGTTYIYLDRSNMSWDSQQIYFVWRYDNSAYRAQASGIGNTKLTLWYGSTGWDNITHIGYMYGNWGASNSDTWNNITQWATDCTKSYNGDFDFKSGNCSMISASGSSKNWDISPIYLGNSYTSLNKTITIKAKVSTNGGTSYSDANTPAKLTGSSKVFTSFTSCAGTTGASTTLNAGSASTTFKAGYTANTTLTAVAATGYTFAGWYSGTKISDNDNLSTTVNPTGDVTYYAYYKANQYTIQFNANGGSGTMSNQSYAYGVSQALTANAFTRTGYTFAGWNTKADGTGTKYTDKQSVSNLSSTNDATVTLYAQWTEKTYSLTFKHDGNGTIQVGGATVNSGSNATVNHFTTKTLVATPNTGYDFSSWTLSGSNTNAVTIGSKNTASTTIKATNTGATVTANFTPKTYAITLNANGGASNGSATATYNSNSVTNANYPSRDGYNCTGYYTATSDGTLVLNTDGTLVKNVSGYTDANGNWIKDGIATLYAQWTEQTYSLTFSHDGNGTIKVEGTTVNSGSTASVNHFTTKTLVAEPNTGYNFSSWTLSGSNTNAVTIGSLTTASTTIKATNTGATVTANFTLKTYTITLDANYAGGTNGSATATYNSNSVTNAIYPTRTDHSCNGYYTEAEGGLLLLNADGTFATNVADYTDANGNWIKDGDVTLYAQWTYDPQAYVVTFAVANGSTTLGKLVAHYSNTEEEITSPANVGSGQSITFKATPNEGYVVEGWYTDPEGKNGKHHAGDTEYTTSISATTNVYVKFEEKQWNVSFVAGTGGSITEPAATPQTVGQVTGISVTATANTGYTFANWRSSNGGSFDSQTSASTTFKPTEATTVTANFTENTYAITVQSNDNELGTVTQDKENAGIVSTITITATPLAGCRFVNWTTEDAGITIADAENSTTTITATAAGTVTANFIRVYTVKYYATPAAAGSVTAKVGENTINSGATHDDNTIITFTATTTNNQCNFIKWVDGTGTELSTNEAYTHKVTDDITVKGIFTINQYTLTFSAGEGGHVSAKANNSAIASPASLDYNTSVTLTAEPDAGCAFEGWYEGSTKKSSNTSYSITLTANKTIKALFTTGTTVYMKAIEYWKKDHPRYAIYYWGAGDKNGWVDMTNVDCNGDIYEGYVPAGYSNFKFVRLAPSTSNEWENKWNETPNLTTTNHAGEMYIQPHVYLKPNDLWKSDNARFAARFWNKDGDTWMSMNDLDEDGVFSCEIPAGYTDVIFVRMNGATTENNWGNAWNQTIDLKVPTTNSILYTLTNSSWNSGNWSAGPHKNGWQNYAKPSYKITYSTPTNGTITVTTKAGAAIESGDELTMGDEIKITFTPADGYELINYNVDYATETGEEGVYSVCGPTNITTVEFAKAGTARTVYLRPNEDWLKDEPIFAAYAWNSKNDKQNHWYIMTTKADDYTGEYSCNISSTYDWVTFVRIKPKGRDNSDGTLDFKNAWNQTINLQIMNNTPRFAIGEERTVDNKQKYDGAWEKNTPIWGLTANFNDWKAEKAVFKGFPGHLDVMPSFGTSHAFKLYNFVYENNKYLGNAGTMKRANSGQWWTMDATEQANCQMMLDVKGDYIYQMRFLTVGAELRKQISVTYPKADTKYALLYKDKNVSRISYDIPAVTGEQNDIISFFVDKDANPTIKLLVNTTETGNAIQVSVKENGVYNFILRQNGGEVTVIAANPEPYKGNYYIRTDAASGGWGGYKQNGNKMTYNSYADRSQNFDHYYCKWVESDEPSYANVKFCVANDYSHKLSDELDGDEIIEKAGVPTGCLPEKANVRFGWDSQTNELSRAYISGSAETKDRFLVLTGNEYLKAIGGGSLNISGLNKNEAIFGDKGNWVYQLDVQANRQTEIKLTAQYNDKVQTFFGDARAAADNVSVLAATNEDYHNVRMIYNFKTNNLVAAWLLNDVQQAGGSELNSDMLVIRKHHDQAQQIQLSSTLRSVGTAYGVMTFEKDFVNDTKKSLYERALYWVSFPFDVCIRDVFGFGEYMDTWIMEYYDGEARATNGAWVDSESYWTYMTNVNDTLKAGVGYVLCLDLDKMGADSEVFKNTSEVSLYFPSATPIGDIDKNQAVPITVPGHQCDIHRPTQQGDRRIADSHWNVIGVPRFINLNITLDGGTIDQQDVVYYYQYNASDNSYAPLSSGSQTFQTMQAYMVQYAGTINWWEVATPQQLAARRNANATPEKVNLRLEIAQDDVTADKTFIQLQEEGATADFDMNKDLTKIINAGTNIYTIISQGSVLTAGNVMPMSECVVPVGVKVDTDGEYTFRMPDGTEGMVVELIDYYTNTRTNLLLFDYTVDLSEGTCNDRFALHIQPSKSGVTTNIDQLTGSDLNVEGVQKYLIDGKLIIRTAEGEVFDAQGHRL